MNTFIVIFILAAANAGQEHCEVKERAMSLGYSAFYYSNTVPGGKARHGPSVYLRCREEWREFLCLNGQLATINGTESKCDNRPLKEIIRREGLTEITPPCDRAKHGSLVNLLCGCGWKHGIRTFAWMEPWWNNPGLRANVACV